MPFLLLLKTAISAIPPSVKRVTVGIACLAAILWAAYLFGDCHGKTVEREHYVTDSLHAAIEAKAAAAHEARVQAVEAVDTAAIRRAALREAIARYNAQSHAIVAAPAITADSDSVRVGYPDGRDTVMHADPKVIAVMRNLAAINARKDSLLANADFILSHQVPAALAADSNAIRKLSFALDRDDSLVVALRAQNAALAKQVARLRPSALDKALRVAKWAAVLYVGAKVYQAVR